MMLVEWWYLVLAFVLGVVLGIFSVASWAALRVARQADEAFEAYRRNEADDLKRMSSL